MARVNVFLPDDLLSAIDAEAERSTLRRSALVQRALLDYLAASRRAREEAEALRGMDDACQAMDALAQKLGEWDPAAVIREFREHGPDAGRSPRRTRGARKAP